MKKFIKLAAVLFLMFSMQSCFFNGVKGDGHVISKKRKISNDFIRIDASRGLDVYITKSKNISLEVEADENLHELIETEVRNGTLYITASRNIYRASAKKVHVSVNNVNEIRINSGAEVYSENTFSSDELVVSASSGGHAKLDLKVNKLRCESSSGAEIVLYGEVDKFKVTSSSGSDIQAYELVARDCNANASSGSDIKLRVTDSFEANASSGADIKYKGEPSILNKNNNSGGSIRQSNG